METHLREQLACPICFELCTPPIQQCTGGHLVCNTCLATLHKQTQTPQCPTCRTSLAVPIRSIGLEQLARTVGLRVTCSKCGKADMAFDDPHVCQNADEDQCPITGCTVHARSIETLVEHLMDGHKIPQLFVVADLPLDKLDPATPVPFNPKRNPTRGLYIATVFDVQCKVESHWILQKRCSKNEVCIGMECMWAAEGAKALTLSATASDAVRTLTMGTQGSREWFLVAPNYHKQLTLLAPPRSLKRKREEEVDMPVAKIQRKADVVIQDDELV